MIIKNWKYSKKLKVKSNKLKSLGVFFGFLLLTFNLFSQHTIDTIQQYPFIDYASNKILVKDSTTLENFYNKLWTYESQRTGQVKVLFIGDSHVQAGYWTGKTRELFHNKFDCGTTARGFVFPYSMAKSNGPINYGIRFNGKWTAQKCIYPDTACNWGLSGINVSSPEDSLFVKVYCNNKTFETYYHDKISVIYDPTKGKRNITVSSKGAYLISSTNDSILGIQTFVFNKLTDTITVNFYKTNQSEIPFSLQGLILENSRPGIVCSEVGVNGAAVGSFVSCKNLVKQVKYYNPDLIVLSLGTNDIYSTNFNDSIFYKHYDSLLTAIRNKMPTASIVLITPGDCKRNRKVTIKGSLLARKTIIALAKKHNCAIWDFLKIMGGVNSIEQWLANGLGNADKVHLSEKGYHFMGSIFYNALIEGYDNHTKGWKVHKIDDQKENFFWVLIKDIFHTDPKDPMIFSNYSFWIFFLILMIGYVFIYNKFKLRALYLSVFSLFFYYKSGGFFFALLVFSTILDYYLSLKIFNSKKKSTKRTMLFISLFINIGLLAFFKYSQFIIDNINLIFQTDFKAVNFFSIASNSVFGTSLAIDKIILPVGISFFTFQTLSYTIDIYYGKIEPTEDIWDFGFFITFFPQLVAGPIVRAADFLPQIKKKYSLTQEDFGKAMFLILTGLFKKVVISDFISVNFVDRVFDNPLSYSGFENLMSIYGYAIQIYCDFSGYSDMAIGIALLLGFTLPLNFNAPYLAHSITEFWKRWHISLSTWLKDYLYIPLGGNRFGKARTYINLLLTMLIGGLWHGAAFKFILWGGLHGGALAVERWWKDKFSWTMPKFIGLILTFHFVAFCWILFRVKDMSMMGDMFNQIFENFSGAKDATIAPLALIITYIESYKGIFAIILLGFLAHAFPQVWERKIEMSLGKLNVPFLSIVTAIMIVIIFQFKTAGIQPFIYFQF